MIIEIALALGLSAEHRHALVDDAFISFRYADRWAHGHGWTWNDGSKVEGFSNPLWTYVLGYLDRLVHIPPHEAALPLGLLAALCSTLLLWGTLIRRGASPLVRVLATGALALDIGLGVWSGSGLETSTAACCVALVLFMSARPLNAVWHGVALGVGGLLMTLVRPEGFLWSAWLGIWLVWGAWVPGRVLAGFLLGWIPVLALFLHRLLVTGSIVSNTFFAKLEPSLVGTGEGLRQLGSWLLAHGAWLALILAGTLWRPKARPGLTMGTWWFLPLGLVLGQALFLIVAGGDWMGRTRYLVPMLPAFYVLGAEALRMRGAMLPTWCVFAVLFLHAGLGWMLRDRVETYTREGEVIGRWLAKTASPTDTVATTASGAIPYFSGLPAIDVLGLNDARVRYRPPRHRGAWAPGHHRYDIEHLLDQAPQWIVWDFGVTVNRTRIMNLRSQPPADATRLDFRRELFAHGKFIALYDVDTNAPAESQRSYTVFRRRD